MSPLEFMQRLAALVPRPRLHLIRFHGVLAPHARLRAAIVPIPAQKTTVHAAPATHTGAAARSVSGGLILEGGRVLARAGEKARRAFAPACGLRETGRSEGQDSGENSAA
jgi:hypothetical protein